MTTKRDASLPEPLPPITPQTIPYPQRLRPWAIEPDIVSRRHSPRLISRSHDLDTIASRLRLRKRPDRALRLNSGRTTLLGSLCRLQPLFLRPAATLFLGLVASHSLSGSCFERGQTLDLDPQESFVLLAEVVGGVREAGVILEASCVGETCSGCPRGYSR